MSLSTDIRMFFHLIKPEHQINVLATVATVDRLPSMAIHPGVVEAKALLLDVARHVNGETTFVGGPLETHMRSYVNRSLGWVASCLSTEDLMAQHQGGVSHLDADEWREIYRALLNGCAGRAPILSTNGTLKPPRWISDSMSNICRLAEVGLGAEALQLIQRAEAQPSADERKLAGQLQADMLRRSAEFLRSHPEAFEEAEHWLKANATYLKPKPRPEGGLSVNNKVWLRMSAPHRVPQASQACETERRHREVSESSRKALYVGARSDQPFMADRECVELLRGNAKSASTYARSSRRSA